jgi:hypothetical protein
VAGENLRTTVHNKDQDKPTRAKHRAHQLAVVVVCALAKRLHYLVKQQTAARDDDVKSEKGQQGFGVEVHRKIGRECIERGVHLHIAKSGIIFDDSMQSKIVATVLGLVAEIERDFISSRTKEALAKRKSEGMKLGRPVGGAKNLKLDKHADKIDSYLDKGINKVAIAKLLDVSPNTLYEWLKVGGFKSEVQHLPTL